MASTSLQKWRHLFVSWGAAMGPKLQRILQASLKEAALYLWRPAARIFWVSCDSRTLSGLASGQPGQTTGPGLWFGNGGWPSSLSVWSEGRGSPAEGHGLDRGAREGQMALGDLRGASTVAQGTELRSRRRQAGGHAGPRWLGVCRSAVASRARRGGVRPCSGLSVGRTRGGEQDGSLP